MIIHLENSDQFEEGMGLETDSLQQQLTQKLERMYQNLT